MSQPLVVLASKVGARRFPHPDGQNPGAATTLELGRKHAGEPTAGSTQLPTLHGSDRKQQA